MYSQNRILSLIVAGPLVITMGVFSSLAGGPPQTDAEKSHAVALPPAKEELIGELAPNIEPLAHTFGDAFVMGYTTSSYCLSPDGRRFAAVARTKKNKWAVVVDGKPGPEFEGDGPRTPGIAEGSPAFSADSQHVSYTGPSD